MVFQAPKPEYLEVEATPIGHSKPIVGILCRKSHSDFDAWGEKSPAVAASFQLPWVRFDDFIDYYNTQRPHQALDLHVPAERYQPSAGA